MTEIETSSWICEEKLIVSITVITHVTEYLFHYDDNSYETMYDIDL